MLAMGCCFALASLWLSAHWRPSYALRDYEECSENAEITATSKDERAILLTQCGLRFAGRRKIGGGYSYHDFMQNRHFDIAGPNPSPEEFKRIDQEYIAYLAVQRRDAIVPVTIGTSESKVLRLLIVAAAPCGFRLYCVFVYA